MPENGWSSSRIRKIAPETDSAQMTSDAKVVALAGAIREKPANKIIIQSSSTAKKRNGYRATKMRKEQESRLRQICGDLHYPLLNSALNIVAWLKLLNPLIERFALSCCLERS